MSNTELIVSQAQAAVAEKHKKPERALPLWLGGLIAGLFIWNLLPFLAPLFMKLGAETPARAIYMAYTAFCHQMAQRSFFLFGEGAFIQMHNIAELPISLAGLNVSESLLALRRFIGSETLGWKVAWSDRMVYMYVTPLLAAVAYAFLRRRRRVEPLPLWAFGLLLMPMALDGATHWLSDFSGIGQGFRYTNEWLANLTNHAFPRWFYAGDAFGSFNSWMRFLSGVTFGIAVIWLPLPYMDQGLDSTDAEPSTEVSET